MVRAVLIVCLCSAAFAQNLLLNPGFEAWVAGSPEYWIGDDSIVLYQEDVIAHGGNFSVRESLFTQTQASADLSQGNFSVQPNMQYAYTVWVYDNDPAGRVRQGIYWYPSGSAWSADYSADSTGWQYLSYTVTSPSDAESAFVMVRAYDISAQWDGDAIFFIDDAGFSAPSTQPPVIVRVWHTPINPPASIDVDVYGHVTDDGSIDWDTLYYGINGLGSPVPLMHVSIVNDTFMYTIPGQIAGDTVFYYAVFVDNDGLSTGSDTHALFIGDIDLAINEVLYDTPGTDSACFIELYGSSGGMSLDNYSLVGVNGYDGSEYVVIDLSGFSLPGDGFFVVAQDSGVANHDLMSSTADLQNGPDNIELRMNNITIDALGYGAIDGWVFTGEWLPAPDVDYDHSLGRYPDGDDTDNNYVDFHDYTTHTPGEPNPYVSIAEFATPAVPVNAAVNPVRAGIRFSMLI
ncbi:hypothetical protein JXB22_04650, partial [candidate division WOR-3 bacterium]|nr:hypothetical protein [candidate division WOR-3 bacterium]